MYVSYNILRRASCVQYIHVLHLSSASKKKFPSHKHYKPLLIASPSFPLPPDSPLPAPHELQKQKMDRAYETSRKRPVKTQYLILYNFISAILWLAVFGRVILLLPILGHRNVYGGVGEFAKWTQTVAVLEILHSASGIIKLIA